MTVRDLRKWISGAVAIYRPLEKAPYWTQILEVSSMIDLITDYDNLPVHHLEPVFDHYSDPCIGIFLDIEEI